MANEIKDYSWLLKEYPEYMNKEQMYKVLHVSKRTALEYLCEGIIPCECLSEHRTHCYKIRTKDVIRFLKYRDKHPHDYIKRKTRNKAKVTITDDEFIKALELVLDDYPDVLDLNQVAEAMDYGSSAVTKWCEKNQIKYLKSRGCIYIPKPSIIEFVRDIGSQKLTQRSYEHILKRANTIRIDRSVGRDNHNYYEKHDET